MKYLAALVIWIGLMTSIQASANDYIFSKDDNEYSTSLDECVKAAKQGIELSEYKADRFGVINEGKRYLYKSRIYILATRQEPGTANIGVQCLFLKKMGINPPS